MPNGRENNLDLEIAKIISENKNHNWETINNIEYCIKCGKPKDDCRLPNETYQYFPCRGFIG